MYDAKMLPTKIFLIRCIFLTFITAPTGPPVDVTAYNTSSTSIKVSWNEVPVDQQNGVILGYHIFYKALPSGEELNETVSNTTLTVNLTGLQEFVQYNISVAALTSHGTGPQSAALFVFTAEDSKYSRTFYKNFIFCQGVFHTSWC